MRTGFLFRKHPAQVHLPRPPLAQYLVDLAAAPRIDRIRMGRVGLLIIFAIEELAYQGIAPLLRDGTASRGKLRVADLIGHRGCREQAAAYMPLNHATGRTSPYPTYCAGCSR